MDFYTIFRRYHFEDDDDYTTVLGVFDNFDTAWEFAISYAHLHMISIDDIEVGISKSLSLGEIFNES